MGYRAVYEFIEDGTKTYAYSHRGGNIATGLWRYNMALEQFHKEKSPCATMAEFLMGIDYNGLVIPRDDMYKYDSDKVFNPISATEFSCSVYDFHNNCDIEAIVRMDADNNLYSYKNRDFYVELPLDEALKEAKELENKPEFPSVYEYGNELEKNLSKIYAERNNFLCVVVEPGLPARREYTDGSLKSLQRLVGGLIEPLYNYESGEDIIMIGNEEARVLELEPNRKFEGLQPLCGTFVILGDGGDDFVSLTEEQAELYCQKFKKPDRFTEQEISLAHKCEIVFREFDFDITEQNKTEEKTAVKSQAFGKGRKL